MPCIDCGRGFHDECIVDSCDICHPVIDLDSTEVKKTTATGGKGAPVKDSESITDPYSTGRKRAAIQYPIFKTNPCEWRLKTNCGGGKHPIVGCVDGKQVDRHHGPVKNPLRNEPGNVHRICKFCHNRWHADNDGDYDESINETLPHSPVAMTEIEAAYYEAERKIKKQ